MTRRREKPEPSTPERPETLRPAPKKASGCVSATGAPGHPGGVSVRLQGNLRGRTGRRSAQLATQAPPEGNSAAFGAIQARQRHSTAAAAVRGGRERGAQGRAVGGNKGRGGPVSSAPLGRAAPPPVPPPLRVPLVAAGPEPRGWRPAPVPRLRVPRRGIESRGRLRPPRVSGKVLVAGGTGIRAALCPGPTPLGLACPRLLHPRALLQPCPSKEPFRRAAEPPPQHGVAQQHSTAWHGTAWHGMTPHSMACVMVSWAPAA